MALPEYFPKALRAEYANPAIRLFGSRFIKDQTILEYLSELLSVMFSEKWITEEEIIETPFPSFHDLKKWSSDARSLRYKPEIKLNLKLLAFLSSSPVSKRHDIHIEHHAKLVDHLEAGIKSNNIEAEEVREAIEVFLQGFHGAGHTRTWCAQTFYPISASLLTQETIFNESKAKRKDLQTWDDSIQNFREFYSNKRDFLARGGELLYLQLCNALSMPQEDIVSFLEDLGVDFDEEEMDLGQLHSSLQNGLIKLKGLYTAPLDNLVSYIEKLDAKTYELVNKSNPLVCEWCPRDSWPEGYLFAVELNRLMSAAIDPVDRLELMMVGCALQVLRSICAQSVRYQNTSERAGKGGGLGYAWIMSAPSTSAPRQQRLASQRNLQVVQRLIQRALRNDELEKYVKKINGSDANKVKKSYKDADDKYGHKLLVSLGKRLGIIIPRTGAHARFIMTDKVLRYFVLTLLKPGERQTDDEFRKRLYKHYGIAVEGEQFEDALRWSDLSVSDTVKSAGKPSWLSEMLRAGGFLTELSDSHSIVFNPFDNNQN